MAYMDTTIVARLHKQIAKVEDAVSLHRLSPVGLGGMADYLTTVSTTVELAAAVGAAIQCNIPYLVVGRASKVLFSDGGFPGLVIVNESKAIAIDANQSQIVVDAGYPLHQLVTTTTALGLGGVTAFFGCGGTVGGAVYRNLQGRGRSFRSLVRSVTVVKPPAKLDAEATIHRYRREWLDTPALQRSHDFKPRPVLLTLTLQLTSRRSDELRADVAVQRLVQPDHLLGPIFSPLITDRSAWRSLSASYSKKRTVYPSKIPFYLAVRQGATATHAWETIQEIGQALGHTPYLEPVGVW
jgi:UDP-N-acetylenolpyruvoylglucosamine reductase